MRPVITACLLAGVTLLLYSFRVDSAPRPQRESQILEQARSGSGPLFFQATSDQWIQPIPVYTTMLTRALGGGDASARIVTVIIAAINVGLIFLCARLLFDGRLAPILAAILMLITPAHVTFARSGTDAIIAVPFAIFWLLAMLHFWSFDRTRSIIAAGAALGIGVYANRAAPLTMGFLLLLSVAAVIVGGRRWRAVMLLLATFGALLLPALVWFALNPATYPDTFGQWVIQLAHVRNPLEGVRAFLHWNTLGDRASLYWGFFDPSWLFFENMLLLVMLPLLLIGMASWRRALSPNAMLLVAGGVVVAPLAGSSFGAPHYAADALVFVPFAILIMTAGAVSLRRHFS